MNRVVEVLMERDDMTEAEAKQEVLNGQRELYDAIHDGADSQEVEDLFMDLFSLEPDYLFDVL